MELVVGKAAKRDFLTLPRADRQRIDRRIEAYLADPKAPNHDVVPIIGRPSTYRLRAGDWRVIFELANDTMTVTRVAHRREVYK